MAVSNTDLIQRVRNLLDEQPFSDTATAASSSSTITVTDGTEWAEGAILEWQDNGEQSLVQSIAGNTLTCKRGFNGTTATSHTSQTCYRDPEFKYAQILQAIDHIIDRIFDYAWKVGSATDITPAPTTTVWYDIAGTTGFVDLVSVGQVHGSSNQKWSEFGEKGSGKPVILKRNMPTTLVASGNGLRFPAGFFDSTKAVKVKYRAFLTGTTDIEDDGKLPVADCIVLGAAAELLAGGELERVMNPIATEDSRAIRPGARIQLGLQYHRQYQVRLHDLKWKHERVLGKPMYVKETWN